MALMKGLKRSMDRHYDKLAKTNCNTCDMGAWAINQSVAQAQPTEGAKMRSFFSRFRKDSKAIEPCAANAEAMCKQACCEDGPCEVCSKILVVCKCTAFSEEMIHYASSMAARTRSDIVALNLDEKEHDFDRFSKQAYKDIHCFARKAETQGVGFSHIVAHGQEEQVLDTLYAKDAGYRYVMDDMPALKGKTHSIPVYSRTPLRVRQ